VVHKDYGTIERRYLGRLAHPASSAFVELLDFLKIVASAAAIFMRKVFGELCILLLEALLFSLLGGKIGTVLLDLFPVLNWLPALLASHRSRDALEHSLLLQYLDCRCHALILFMLLV